MVTESHGRIERNSIRTRFGLAAAAVLASSIALTGCATGQDSQTANQIPAVDGVGADAGQLAIRAAGVSAPLLGPGYKAGADATLKLVLVNSGPDTVALRAVSTTAAQKVTLGLNGPADTANPGSAATNTTIAIPSNGTVQVGYSNLGATITLSGLTQSLNPSQSIPVTFSFTNGATISTTLAVQITSDANGAPTVDITPPAG